MARPRHGRACGGGRRWRDADVEALRPGRRSAGTRRRRARRRRPGPRRGRGRSRAGGHCPASHSATSSATASEVMPRSLRPSSAAKRAMKPAGQIADVLAALAQRRQRDREDVEAIIEVLAELAALHLLRAGSCWWRRSGGCRRFTGFLAPTGSTSPSWMARSSLTWVSSGNSPTSSRKSVPPLASANLPSMALGRAGEGALLVAEEDGSDEVRRQSAAIHRDEGLAACARSRPGWRGPALPCRRRISPSISIGMFDVAARSARRTTRSIVGAAWVTRSRKPSVSEARCEM